MAAPTWPSARHSGSVGKRWNSPPLSFIVYELRHCAVSYLTCQKNHYSQTPQLRAKQTNARS